MTTFPHLLDEERDQISVLPVDTAGQNVALKGQCVNRR